MKTCNHYSNKAFTLAEVLIVKRERGKMSLLNLFRTSKLKEPSNKLYKQCAFTLAEVLITLGIIGVVAAMTLPVLIADKEKKECVTALKKFYSDFTQALQLYSVNNGCPNDLGCTDMFNSSLAGHFKQDVYVTNELRPYLKIDKVCGGIINGASNNLGDGGCFHYQLSKRPYKELDGDVATGTLGSVYELSGDRIWATMQNGVFFGVLNLNEYGGYGCVNSTKKSCAHLYVDVNGVKKPNQIGRDVFYFYITKDAKLKPTNGTDCSTSSGVGGGCSNNILNSNWEMNY